MKGLCDEKESPEFEPQPDHFVKCWLYDETLNSPNWLLFIGVIGLSWRCIALFDDNSSH
jgi:hypothetical protein